MTTLYNGQLFIQGLTLYTAAQGMGITTSDTIVSVLDSIANNSSQKVMLEIGSCNMNLGNKGSVYKYLLGMSNRTDGLGGEFHIQSLASLTTSPYASATPITRFMINASGNVGIGTTTPAYLLDVNGTTRLNGATTITGATIINGTTVVAADAAYSNVSTGQDTNKYAQFTIAQSTASSRLYFATTYTANKGAASVIQSSDFFLNLDHGINLCLNPLGGNVGVNTKVPAYNLDVTGTTNLNGATTVTGTTNLNGQTNLNGAARFSKDVWNTSSDAALRFYFANGGASYFGSGSGYFSFRNQAQNVDNVVIDNAGNMNVVGNISAANIQNSIYSVGYNFKGQGNWNYYPNAPIPRYPGVYMLQFSRNSYSSPGTWVGLLIVNTTENGDFLQYEGLGLFTYSGFDFRVSFVDINTVNNGNGNAQFTGWGRFYRWGSYVLGTDMWYGNENGIPWQVSYRKVV